MSGTTPLWLGVLAAVGALIGAVAGLIGVYRATRADRRNRPDVQLSAVALIDDDDWAIELRAYNAGLQPTTLVFAGLAMGFGRKNMEAIGFHMWGYPPRRLEPGEMHLMRRSADAPLVPHRDQPLLPVARLADGTRVVADKAEPYYAQLGVGDGDRLRRTLKGPRRCHLEL